MSTGSSVNIPAKNCKQRRAALPLARWLAQSEEVPQGMTSGETDVFRWRFQWEYLEPKHE